MIISKNKYENIFSAPIAGYTNWPLRMLFSEYKAGRIFSEMIHVREILHNETWKVPLINIPYKFTIQLFGSFEDDFNFAISQALNFCDNVDINSGCPVKKVIKAGGGSFWLTDLNRFSSKIKLIANSFPYIISVKIRLGFMKSQIVEILDSIKDSKLAYITIHMRTANMLFSGKALYEYADLIKNYPIPIILNGDINSPEMAKDILDKYECSGIMIGRAALNDPSIFNRINLYLKEGKLIESNNEIRVQNIIKYIDYLRDYLNLIFYNDDYTKITNKDLLSKIKRSTIIESRKILFSLTKKIPFSHNIKEEILKISTDEDLNYIKDAIMKFNPYIC